MRGKHSACLDTCCESWCQNNITVFDFQVGHNVRIGAHTAVAACCGIAGSAVIGQHCVLAGMVGVGDHVNITDHVVITAQSGVSRDITEAGVYSSTLTVLPVARWRRLAGRLRHLDELFKRVNSTSKGE